MRSIVQFPKAAIVFFLGLLLLGSLFAPLWAQKSAQEGEDVLRGSIVRKDWYEASESQHKWYEPKSWRVRKADQWAEEYKLGAAEYYYRIALKANPQDAGAHNGLGKIYYQQTTSSNQNIRKNMKTLKNRAIQEFLTALRYEPGYAEAHLNLGKVYLEQNRVNDAKEHFAQALALNPNSSEAQEMVGQVLLDEGGVNEAIPFFIKALELDSANTSAHYKLGKAYTTRGDYDLAYEQLNIALYQHPNNAPVQHQLGVLYQEQGNGSAAINAFKKAIAIKPEYADASLHLARHYQARGDHVLAIEQLKNTLESVPDREDPRYSTLAKKIAQMHLANQQADEAAFYYQKVLRSQAQDEEAKKGMSQVVVLKAKKTQALAMGYGGDLLTTTQSRKQLEQALAYDPSNIQAKMIQVKLNGGSRALEAINPAAMSKNISNPAYMANQNIARGEIWTARFDYNRAKQEFESAMHSVRKPEDIIQVGEMLLDMGQPDFAIKTFKRAMNEAAAQEGIRKAHEAQLASQSRIREALLYKKKSTSSEKRRILDEAIHLDHRNAEAHLLLGELYSDYKNYAWAIRHYHVYLSLNPPPEEAQKVQKRIRRLTKKHIAS